MHALLLLSVSTLLAGQSQTAAAVARPVPLLRELAARAGDPDARVRLNRQGQVRSVHGQLGRLGNGRDVAAAFVRARAALLGLTDRDTLRVISDEEDAHGNRHVKLERQVRGIPVEADEVRLHASRDGMVRILEAELSPLQELVLDAKQLSAGDAVRRAFPTGVTPVEPADPTRVIVGGSLQLARPRVAWRVNVSYDVKGDVGVREFVYVDVMTGARILVLTRQYNAGTPTTMQSQNLAGQNVTIHVTQHPQSILLVDSVTIPQAGTISTVNGGENYAYYQTSSTGSPFTDRAAVTIHSSIKSIMDAYRSRYGFEHWNFATRPSTRGGQAIAVAHEGTNYANATFSTTTDNGVTFGVMRFGDGDNNVLTQTASCYDVAAHELGHGVVQGTAGLVYQFQSGALNEHMADVLGWLEDQEDDLIGEDCAGPAVAPALRDMCNPGNVPQGQPGHMSMFQNLPNTEDGDYGGVHINSGIPNKAACNARNTVGAQKVGQVWFQTVKNHLGPSSTFADMVAGTSSSCGEVSLSGADCASIAQAWADVGLAAGASMGGCPANATEQNGQCFCNSGFEPNSEGTGCQAIASVSCPPNSTAQEGSCYCNVGYVPSSDGSACAPENMAACPSNSHREGGSCVCDPCFQGNPNGNGDGCNPTPNCATCQDPLESGEGGSCQCITGISEVCGDTSMTYSVMVGGMEVTGEICCRPDNPCGWADDGACDCFSECGWDSNDCQGTTGEEALCRARNLDVCGAETWAGRCVGDVLIWCDDRTVMDRRYVSYVHCPTYQALLVCGADAVNGGFNCVEQQSQCGDVPASGRCSGSTGQYCNEGVIESIECTNGCGDFTYMGTSFQYCYPCPANSTLSDDQCLCNGGYRVGDDGTSCVSDSAGGAGADGGQGSGDDEESCRCAELPSTGAPWLGLVVMGLFLARRRS